MFKHNDEDRKHNIMPEEGDVLSMHGQLISLQIKTTAGSKLNPYDLKKAMELAKTLHSQNELSSEDYSWLIQNKIRWA